VNRSLAGRTALVTGGTDGIGKAIARGLAAMGAEVLIVGSDPEKGTRAERDLRATTGHERVHFLQADLSLVRDTDRLAHEITARGGSLHYLVLCAGVVRGRRLVTPEGVESNFAINYLSRFVLAGRLLPLLQAAGAPGAAARIIVIGCAAMNGKIHYDDINLTRNFRNSHHGPAVLPGERPVCHRTGAQACRERRPAPRHRHNAQGRRGPHQYPAPTSPCG
jgi:NAD(P)-dependent dehydrogenase (short-subunit alcohol dehydrogenase family)